MNGGFDRDIGEICAHVAEISATINDFPPHLIALVACQEDQIKALNRLAKAIEGIESGIIFAAIIIGAALLITGGKL